MSSPKRESGEKNDTQEAAFRCLAERELDVVRQSIPNDPNHRFAVFLEVVRLLDYWTVIQSFGPPEKRLAPADFQILRWGWNRAVAHLLSPVTLPGIPIMKSTRETRQYALTVLHEFGRSVLMHRTADMIAAGFVSVESSGNSFVVRNTGDATWGFADLLDISAAQDLEANLRSAESQFQDWEIIDPDDTDAASRLGRFCGMRRIDFEKWKHPNIESLMIPLIHPWDSGYGMMMGYGAEPEIDHHFLAEAMELVEEWRFDAGIHPTAKVADTTGAEAAVIALVIISLHLKHVRFALLAAKHHPTISLPLSLTIWGPEADLINSIAELTRLDKKIVQRALNTLILRANEAPFLHNRTEAFVPLLIGVGNQFLLQPVSSLAGNPLTSISVLAQNRDRNSAHALLKPREDWLRSHIYGLFRGKRYECFEGTRRLRAEGRIITDIDATIFDRTTGELALIQIKCQDYYTNDVRQLRSKVCNLVKEVDEWAERVTRWLAGKTAMAIAQNLRLSTRKNRPISAVYLFAISQSVARTRGYGYVPRHQSLALANWSQFFRIRAQVGPAPHVFDQMHRKIREEINQPVNVRPLPVDVTVAGHNIRFEDLWNTVDDDENE